MSLEEAKPMDKKRLHASVSRKLYKALHVRGILFRGFDEFAEEALWRQLNEWNKQHPRD
ncbi:MAG: hypothetical protein ACXQTM_05040 [Methanosarcinales archaeon]